VVTIASIVKCVASVLQRLIYNYCAAGGAAAEGGSGRMCTTPNRAKWSRVFIGVLWFKTAEVHERILELFLFTTAPAAARAVEAYQAANGRRSAQVAKGIDGGEDRKGRPAAAAIGMLRVLVARDRNAVCCLRLVVFFSFSFFFRESIVQAY
jgi:hypothetical protein